MNQTAERKREPALQANDRPACFGDPDLVCPRDERGFIEPQPECLSCKAVKTCLQMGLRLRGVLPEPADEASTASSRVTGFLKRWSNQKLAGSNASGRDECK